MKAKVLSLILILAVASILVASQPAYSNPGVISGVLYDFDIQKVSSGKFTVVLTIEMLLTNHTETELVVPIGLPISDAELQSFTVTVGGKNIVTDAKLETGGLLRAVAKLSEPIKEEAKVEIKIKGVIKSKAKLYVTKEYKLYKDYKPIYKKTLYIDVVNYFYDITWNTAKVNGEKVPGLRVRFTAPEGWEIFYARSSLTGKLRYMEIKDMGFKDSRMYVEFWWLDTKKITPKSFKPANVFSLEIGVLPKSDYTNPTSLAFGIIVLLLAAFFAWYYRDVWKYTSRKLLQK